MLAIHQAMAPEKDVDGLTPVSVGRLVRGEALFEPCTPLGIMALLDHARVPIEGSHAE